MSTESQIPEQGSLIPPGNKTGVYYIVVAGLPWNTSWQSLKDFAKRVSDGTQLNIDYAMVYPASTDGWVRVVGLKPFRKVLARLDGGAFNNRNLIADGRNETQYLNLRAMKPTRTLEPSEQQACQPTNSSRPPTPPYAFETPPQSPSQFGPSPPPTYYYNPQPGPLQWKHTPQPSPVFLPVHFVPYILPPTYTLDPVMTSKPPPIAQVPYKGHFKPARNTSSRTLKNRNPRNNTHAQPSEPPSYPRPRYPPPTIQYHYPTSQRSGSVSSSSTYTVPSSTESVASSLDETRIDVCVTPPPRAVRTPAVVDGSCGWVD